jgi:hypothetical protein
MLAKSSMRHWHTVPRYFSQEHLVELLRQRRTGRLGK